MPSNVVDRVCEWYEEMANEDDRIIIIVGAGKLDELVTHLLKSHMLHQGGGNDDLFGHDRPLGTFSSRILLAYRLGIISRDFESFLQTLRKLRNEAAHSSEKMDLSSSPRIQWIEHLFQLASKGAAWDRLFQSVPRVTPRESPRIALMRCFLIALFNCEAAVISAKPFTIEGVCNFNRFVAEIVSDEQSQ